MTSFAFWLVWDIKKLGKLKDVEAMEFVVDEYNVCIHKDINKNIEIKEDEDCENLKNTAYFVAKNYITIKDIENEFKKNKYFLTSRHFIFARFNKVDQVKIRVYFEYEKDEKKYDTTCCFLYSAKNRTSLKIVDILKS